MARGSFRYPGRIASTRWVSVLLSQVNVYVSGDLPRKTPPSTSIVAPAGLDMTVMVRVVAHPTSKVSRQIASKRIETVSQRAVSLRTTDRNASLTGVANDRR